MFKSFKSVNLQNKLDVYFLIFTVLGCDLIIAVLKIILIRIFQGCFTVQFSMFFVVALSSDS